MRGGERVFGGGTNGHYGNKTKEKETTFFIENLPEGVSNTMLWKAFSPHGIVTDAYVARKKDARGNHFGFVRYIRVRDLKGDLARMNTVKIKEAKLTVSMAKYDKKHTKINNVNRMGKTGGVRKGQTGGVNWKPTGTSDFPPAWRQDGRSYRDVVGKQANQYNNATKTIETNEVGAMYPNRCIGKSIVGVAKDIMSLKNLVLTIDKDEKDLGVSYIGGLNVMVACKDRKKTEEVLERNRRKWESMVTKLEVWNGEEIINDRVLRLFILGLPVQLRDGDMYDKIGRLFGKVVGPSEFSWQDPNNAMGECHVLAPLRKRIDEEVIIRWKNKSYSAWVKEDSESWSPFFGESKQDHEIPMQHGSDVEDIGGGMEMEEGEFRSDIPPEDANFGGKENPTNFQGENQPSLHEDNSSHVHEEHGELEGLGAAVNSKKEGTGTPLIARDEVDRGPTGKKGMDIEKDLGHTTPAGPNSQQVLGKRNRAIRSPPSLGSTQGPKSKLCQETKQQDLAGLDLNSPPIDDKPKSRESNPEGGETVEVPEREKESQTINGDPDGLLVDEEKEKRLEEETVATKQIGALIGVDLHGYEATIKEIITGEGGSDGFQ